MSALDNRKRVLQVEYDFAKDGGAVGDITLRGGGLPAGAVVTSGVIDMQTTLASGGAATIALKVAAAGDVLAAGTLITALSSGANDVVPDGTAANMIKTTAAASVTASIGVAALTAGKLVVCLEYYITTS